MNRPAKRLSYHTDFNAAGGNRQSEQPVPQSRSPTAGRWRAVRPARCSRISAGTSSSPRSATSCRSGRSLPNTRFHPNFPAAESQQRLDLRHRHITCRARCRRSLIKGRYGEPILTRIYNNLPVDRAENSGFGRNETQLHFHNAHNGAESDGAANCHHFPGTFYDYRWSTTLARRDKINTAGDRPARLGTRRQWRPGPGAGRLPRDPGHHVGPRPPLLLHRRECLQGQSHDDQLLQRPGPRQRGAQRRRQPAAAERQAAGLRATSTSTST